MLECCCYLPFLNLNSGWACLDSLDVPFSSLSGPVHCCAVTSRCFTSPIKGISSADTFQANLVLSYFKKSSMAGQTFFSFAFYLGYEGRVVGYEWWTLNTLALGIFNKLPATPLPCNTLLSFSLPCKHPYRWRHAEITYQTNQCYTKGPTSPTRYRLRMPWACVPESISEPKKVDTWKRKRHQTKRKCVQENNKYLWVCIIMVWGHQRTIFVVVQVK